MKLIFTEQDFLPIEVTVEKLVDKSKNLHENVFKEPLRFFLFITFCDLLLKPFPTLLKRYLTTKGETGFWVTAVDPDPRQYFAKHYGFFNTFEMRVTDEDEEYFSALHNYPKENGADALAINTNLLLVASFSHQWAIWADRDYDMAICAFSDVESKELFQSIYGSGLGDAREAAKYSYSASGALDLIEAFTKNYSNQTNQTNQRGKSKGSGSI